MSKGLESLLVGIKLLSVNYELKTGTVKFSIYGDTVVLKDVMIDGLILSSLLREDSESIVELGRDYISDNNSSSYKANPFCLVKYLDKINGDVRYYLRRVNSAGSSLSYSDLPTGKRMAVYTNYSYRTESYMRYIDLTNKSMKDMNRKVFVSSRNTTLVEIPNSIAEHA